ncbi:MAG: shikimate kinase AroK [Gammaproteobacteria bacterium]|nr:shikimate kinase AroK [Gammaproteobacteria bacterium]
MPSASSSPKKNIILVGPMGAGKTTIGIQLAKQLDREFIDSDREIEKRTGATIPLIFELEGEEGFRKREASVISELVQMQNIVLATGGGAVLRQENREALSRGGLVIYLKSDVEQLFERTSKDKSRPLLQTDDPKRKLTEILHQREPLYEAIADLVVKTGDNSVKSVVDRICKLLKSRLSA